MNLNEYQTLSRRTLPKDGYFNNLSNYGMGISGESGEVTDELKKFLYHGHKLDIEKVKGELGGVLHYLAGIATMLEIDLSDVAQSNINKLRNRYPSGFNSEDSINRRE